MNTHSIVAAGCLHTGEKINCPDVAKRLPTCSFLETQCICSAICLYDFSFRCLFLRAEFWKSHHNLTNLGVMVQWGLTGLVVDACLRLGVHTKNQQAQCDTDFVWQFYGTSLKLWMYFLHFPLISHQLTTHKIRIIKFWFSFSSCLCIKFSPISTFLFEVSCSYISTARLFHDKGQTTCTWLAGVVSRW